MSRFKQFMLAALALLCAQTSFAQDEYIWERKIAKDFEVRGLYNGSKSKYFRCSEIIVSLSKCEANGCEFAEYECDDNDDGSQKVKYSIIGWVEENVTITQVQSGRPTKNVKK